MKKYKKKNNIIVWNEFTSYKRLFVNEHISFVDKVSKNAANNDVQKSELSFIAGNGKV